MLLDTVDINYLKYETVHDNIMFYVKNIRDKFIPKYMSAEMLDDKDLMIKIVNVFGDYLYGASDRLRKDIDVIKVAINNMGLSIRFALIDLKKHKNLVIQAVKQDPKTLRILPPQYTNDIDVVMQSCLKNIYMVVYATKRLRYNKYIINRLSFILNKPPKIIIKEINRWYNMHFYNKYFYEYRVKAMSMGRYNCFSYDKKIYHEYYLCGIPNNKRNDPEAIMKAIKIDGMSLKWALLDLKLHRNIVLESVKQNGNVLSILPVEYIVDKEVVITALKQNKKSIIFVPKFFIMDNKKFI
jgi:hypothetical protein